VSQEYALAYRDVNIALANEFALVAEQVGINVWEAITLANRHPRVQILQPGPGVGGHCIAVDPWFIAHAAPHVSPLIQAARRLNDTMPVHVLMKYPSFNRLSW
jgi:UDP-N-acetyl-D-mannosaminuronic acid dehydrogenase